jgi:hypothetical protein
MPMIKRGDGSTGRIVEAASSDDKDVCVECGRLFEISKLTDGKCESCESDEGMNVEAASDDDGSCCCEKGCDEG